MTTRTGISKTRLVAAAALIAAGGLLVLASQWPARASGGATAQTATPAYKPLPQIHGAVSLFYGTGIRASECAGLREEDVELARIIHGVSETTASFLR